jgi:peptide/nickel transport system substrate-binding protein
MKSFARFVALVLLVAIAFSSVSAQDFPREETVIFDIDGGQVRSPELWNPYVVGVSLNQGAHQSMWEPLFILNYGTGEVDPWLGESMTSNEAMDVWTLKLREGIKWQDGEDFNADDVVFSVQVVMDNVPELRYSSGFVDWIEEVEKVDDLTVEFTLTRPNPRFQLDNFSTKVWGSFIVVPEHVFKGQDILTFTFYDQEKGWPFATGPYKPVSVSETEFIYERQDDWWGVETGFKDRLPHPKYLIWTWAATEDTRAAMMANSELDSIMDITVGAYYAIQAQNPNVIGWTEEVPAWIPDPCPRNITINHTVEPWGDPDMRKALSFVIDRQQIVDISYEGVGMVARSPMVEYTKLTELVDAAYEAGAFGSDEENPFIQNLDKAAEILESKGYAKNGNGYWEKDGEVLSLIIDCHEGFIELKRNAQVVVEQLQNFGIDASIRALAGATWGDNIGFGEYEAVSDWHYCGSVNEPWASMNTDNIKWLEPIGERAPGNSMRWDSENAEKYSELVDEIGVLPLGDPKIEELFIEAMEVWVEDMPFIPVTQARKLIPFDTTYWTNWPTLDNHYSHPCTWWATTHVMIHNIEPAQ